MKKIIFVLVASFISALSYPQNVDQFSGSFNYSYPLLMVPSNRGNAISIDASYGAGIQMEQKASEIGLGWGINAGGAIYRSVSGIPDDTKSYTLLPVPSWQSTLNAQGALYPQVGTATDYDLIRINRGLDTSEFTFPDYDHYSISGPIIGGQLKLSCLKFYSYATASPDYKIQPTNLNHDGYYRKPQFHFAGDFADTLTSRHYSTQIYPGISFVDPTHSFTGLGYTSSAEPYVGEHLNGSTVSNQNFDTTSGRLATSNFVEYFTNDEIATALGSSLASLETNGSVFIDYTSSHNRNAPAFPADGIGYFRVTASNGLTYHYSLPVYELQNTSYYIPLKNDYSLESGLDTSDIDEGPGNEYIKYPPNNNVGVKSESHNKIAQKWLLTAITGPDYVDDGNNFVNDADSGYWVGYDYQLWNKGFIDRAPYYGYDLQYSPDQATQKYPVYFPLAPNSNILTNPYKLSGLNGSVNVSKTQEYYLSKIRTSSHTAVFVRDVRLDEKGGDTSVVAGIRSFKPAPSLLLKRIILFRNEQLDSVLTAHPTIAFNTSNYSSYAFSSINNAGNIFSEAWYQANLSNFSFCILKHIFFDQDYSLCRKYYGNINNDYSGSSVLTPPGDVETNFTSSNYSSSGKLTLNRILIYDFQNIKVVPSTMFDYNYADAFSNPDYCPRNTDYWGYFKYDAPQDGYSRYTTSLSQARTKAWSLQKITDPLGGITEIEYESNSYKKVIDNEVDGGVRGAAFIYRIALSNTINTAFDITMEEGSSTSNNLMEFPNFTPSNIPGLKQKICIPYSWSTCSDDPLCLIHVDMSIDRYDESGFVFGDCTTTVNAGGGGSTDHITGSITTPTPAYRTASNIDFSRKYYGGSHLAYSTTTSSLTSGHADITYSGNGFLMFETPIGYEVYGNGIRVKRIKSTNSFNAINDTYVTEYTYEDGVATNEMDRFDYQVLKRGCAVSIPRYDFLQPKSFTPFDLAPAVGYSKVTVKNLGRISSANGKTETTFITDPNFGIGTFAANYAVQTVTSATTPGGVLHINTINECVNGFSNIFGSISESKVFDRNDNLIQKTEYEYDLTEQGALVENFYFIDTYFGSNNYPSGFNYLGTSYSSAQSFTVNIMREYPVITKSTTNYGIGSLTQSQSLGKDEITGETTAMQSSGGNQSSSISYKIPAYKFYQPAESIDFTMASFRKILTLGSDMYTYSNVDSTFTPVQTNGYSASFLSAKYNLFSKKIRQRSYNSTTGLFTTATQTLPYYANNRTFIFNAGSGSENVYGLLAKSNLTLNPLPLTTIKDTLFWEPNGTFNWKLMYEHTLLDNYKNLVEVRDLNNRFSASRFGYNGYYKSASVSNCNYSSFTFADFETPAPNSGAAMLDGEIAVNNHTLVSITTLTPHTGSRCLEITGTPVTFTAVSAMSPLNTLEIGLQSGRFYRASVWAHSSNLSNATMEITINGTVYVASPYTYSLLLTANSASNLVTTIGNWNLLQIDFEIPEKFRTATGEFTIKLKSANNSEVYFDDFVFHPVESDFSANVYNPRNGRVMSMIDGNGLATNYFYDAAGRTVEIWKEVPSVGYKKTKTYTYNYARGASN